MKRKLLINQYESVKALIVSNVQTINVLVEQADGLTKLARSLKDDETGKGKETAEKIEEIASGLKESIKDLIEKTSELFDEYYKFAEEVFDK